MLNNSVDMEDIEDSFINAMGLEDNTDIITKPEEDEEHSNSNNADNADINDVNDDEKELECHARIISFFAHKGGVSKTTNVHHLGYMLASKFKFRVLMIDADPQQNLTQMCCPDAKSDPAWRDDVERGTIFTAIERLHYGMKDGEYIDAANCLKLDKDNADIQLYLLPGSLDLAKLEPQITFAHNITNPAVFPLFDDIAGGFRHLFIATCAEYNIDFCLIDMGPSIGELNKSLFWSSDYFVIPCSADSYCKTTIETMKETLPIWQQQQQRLSVITQEMNLYLNPDPPKFLGVIFSLFQVSGKHKSPIRDSQHWMDVIKQTVEQKLVPVLKQAGMYHEYSPSDFTLAHIPNFLSLMPIAQRSFSTVYAIPDAGFSHVLDDGQIQAMAKSEMNRHKERGKYFERIYSKFAEVVVNMINSEEEDEADEEDDNDIKSGRVLKQLNFDDAVDSSEAESGVDSESQDID